MLNQLTPFLVHWAITALSLWVASHIFSGIKFETTGALVVSALLLGFANAMMWPAIFPLAIRGLGRFTETGSALLVMAIAGGAIIPQAFAVLKQHFDFQWVFAGLMVPCYLYILFYSLRGHRVGLPRDGQ